MKADTLNTIVSARILFDSAQQLCMVDDKHIASAGLVILQDAVELLLYACLIKSGTLKAMNKQRVIVKHCGQLAEPTTVRHYFEMSQIAIDDFLQKVVRKPLNEIVLYDIIKNSEVRQCLADAEKDIEAKNYWGSLVEVRKAIFLEVEEDYSIINWKDTPRDGESPSLAYNALLMKGFKAPWWVKNKEWIEENVKDPFDYIQLDYERIRLDLLEWGVSTQDFWNLWRLTPSVIRESKESEWLIKGDVQHLLIAPTEQNARYCLDRACSMILKKQSHSDLSRQLSSPALQRYMVKPKSDQPLFQKASSTSKVIDTLQEGHSYSVNSFVRGLSEKRKFVNILHLDMDEPKKVYTGYMIYDPSTCELIDLAEKNKEKQ
jgi:hypothetical protein